MFNKQIVIYNVLGILVETLNCSNDGVCHYCRDDDQDCTDCAVHNPSHSFSAHP